MITLAWAALGCVVGFSILALLKNLDERVFPEVTIGRSEDILEGLTHNKALSVLAQKESSEVLLPRIPCARFVRHSSSMTHASYALELRFRMISEISLFCVSTLTLKESVSFRWEEHELRMRSTIGFHSIAGCGDG